MTKSQTSAGTPVLEMTTGEHQAFLEQEARDSVGMSIAEFTAKVKSRDVDWDDPETFYVAGLLGIGQNGHQPSA